VISACSRAMLSARLPCRFEIVSTMQMTVGFSHFVGQPPMQYLTQWRMQAAATLLRESRAPVASIALDVGYESEAAFTRAFKRQVGKPPAAWRRSQNTAAALKS